MTLPPEIAPAVALLPRLRNSQANRVGKHWEHKYDDIIIAALTAMEGLGKTHVMVPVEPTQEMCDAAHTAGRGIPGGLSIAGIYRAMIAQI